MVQGQLLHLEHECLHHLVLFPLSMDLGDPLSHDMLYVWSDFSFRLNVRRRGYGDAIGDRPKVTKAHMGFHGLWWTIGVLFP